MSRVPRIRFKGFEEDWEQRKLGEMYTQLVERNIELLPFEKILSVSTMSYKVDGSGAAEESLSNYKRLRVGDIAFEGHTSKDFRYGRFVLNDTGDGIMSPRFSALRPICVMPIKFWKYYIHYEPIMKNILVNSTKSGTMMNELVVEEFLKEILLVPEEYEQQKIGIFFNHLDHLITLHQRKLEKLKIIKKSMLENLFPQNGEKTPKIRFSGFTEDWEQRKLGEMSSMITKGTTPLDKSNIGNVNFVKIESIDEASGEITITKKITNEEHEGYLRRSQLKENDILFSIAGTLGLVTSVKSSILPANTNQALAIIRRKTGDIQYIKTYLKGKVVSDYIKKNPTIGAQPNLSLEQVRNLEIALPILDEQKKIGEYFSGLDNLITLHQSKLEKLQKIKKSMLESMFV